MSPWRASIAAALAAALGSSFAAEPAAAPKHEPGAPQVIKAPHYGDVLFHFYQDRTFAAITGLMVSQHFERIAPHDEEAEVLRGGLLLAYGLHDEAAAVFTALIERNAAPAVRDRAWYFLAKLRWQRGLLAGAEQNLSRIEKPLGGTLEEDHQLLRAQLLMARQDFAGAAQVLDALKGSPTAGLYAKFNLGVALIKAGDTDKGQALLDEVGQTPAPNEELRSLRDRANVALGFATLAAKKPIEARAALQRVRLTGPQSNKALLGFGWAASEQNDPKLALVPWTELAARPHGDASVLEARIAVPYAFAELGAYGQALQGYQDAVEGFEKEARALRESIDAVRAGKLVQGLVSTNPSEGLAAFRGIDKLPEMPHASHLAPLLASDEFQEAFKNLRDLQFLEGNLQRWLDNLSAYSDMLENRQRAFAEKLPAAEAGRGAAKIAELRARRDALAAELERVQAESDAAALATPRERQLLERVARGRKALGDATEQGGIVEKADAAEATERLRRAAGALTWQLAQEFNARSWEAKKAMRSATIGIAQATDRDAALTQAQQDEPLRHQRFAERIRALGERLLGMRPDVATTARAVQIQLQDIAVAELERQQERLAVYAAQARLAIAQIHDRAQFARRSDGAEGPR